MDQQTTGRVRPGGVGAGLIAVCLWGLAPVATRALVSQLAPLALLTVRQLLAASVLLPWAVPVMRRIAARDMPWFVAAGLLGMIGYNLPVTVGLQWLPASSAGLLLATEPVWVLVLSYVFLGERAGRRVLIGSGRSTIVYPPNAMVPSSTSAAPARACVPLAEDNALGPAITATPARATPLPSRTRGSARSARKT